MKKKIFFFAILVLTILHISFFTQLNATTTDSDIRNDLLDSININPQDLVPGSVTISEVGYAIIYGNHGFLQPTEGNSFLILSNGAPNSNQFPNGWKGNVTDTLSTTNNNPRGTCPLGGDAYDITTLSFSLRVPEWANSISFNFRFMSEEYPEYVGQEYNDFFICLLDGKNIVYDTEGKIINVNNNFFDPNIITDGSVFNAATVLLTAKAPIVGNSIVTLEFMLGDVGDDVLDSAVFLDNFHFSGNQVSTSTTTPTSLDTYDSIRDARSLSIIGVVGVGVTTATALLVSLGPTINAAIQNLPIPSQLRSFLKFYGASLFQKVDKTKLQTLEKTSFITKKELIFLGISISMVTLVYSFVETNGLQHFLNPSVLAVVIPSTFVSVCIVTCTKIFSDAYCAKTCKIHRKFSLWITGVLTFIISGLFFLFPFSSPGTTRYQYTDINQKTKAQLILSKTLILLTLTIPFYLLFSAGFKIIADAGMLLTLMSACYSLVPIKYLAGKIVYDYNKKYSLITFVSTLFLFISFTINLLPLFVYLPVGIISAFLAIFTIKKLKLSQTPKKPLDKENKFN